MAHWILQNNPAHWRAGDFFHDGFTGTTWPIGRYRERITPGDAVALWLTGRQGGVVALGRVTAAPYRGIPEDPYRLAVAESWLLPVEFDDIFLEHPIGREALESDHRVTAPLVLRGANPHPIDANAWPAVVARVPASHAMVAATVRGAAAVVAAGATAVREAFRAVVR